MVCFEFREMGDCVVGMLLIVEDPTNLYIANYIPGAVCLLEYMYS